MSGRLRCYSFHSVKGGVGKSALATLCAMRLARKHSGMPVHLIDIDLTGTSIADVLPLQAKKPPLGIVPSPECYSLEETRQKIRERDALSPTDSFAGAVPFLNDFLLFATPSWDARTDLPPSAFEWTLAGGPANLRVFPSSALPVDLMRIVPVIFDEEHSAFLEARLEYLLAGLVPEHGEAAVVIDTPPTIPGLSRSVLSLALRLTPVSKVQLSEDAGMPKRLEEAGVAWRACIVATLDRQDLRAAARWLQLLSEEEQQVVRVILNRSLPADKTERSKILADAIGEEEIMHPLMQTPIWFDEIRGMNLFRSERIPPDILAVDDILESE